MPATTDLVRSLNRNCLCAGADVAALRLALERHLPVLHARIAHSHPHLFSATPVFVSERQVEQMQALIRAIEFVVGTPGYREAVLAAAPPIAQIDPKARGVFAGYDFHLSEDGPQLIEVNTNAGGALLNVALNRAQRACCIEVESRFRTFSAPGVVERSIVEMFRHEWRAALDDRELKHIAIVDDDTDKQYLYPELLLFQKLFEEHGISASVIDARQLAYRRGMLLAGGRRIDLVYNRLTDFYFEEPRHAPLAAAYRQGTAVITPHPRAHALYANKRNLITLTSKDALATMHIPQDTIDVLLRGIPETLAVNASDAAQWWSNRNSWFFKPEKGFGSRGSYRGDKLTRSVFAEILTKDYVAQRIAPPSERSVPSIEGRKSLKLDVRMYVYAGVTQLMGVRLYQGQTTNFRSEGGGFAPVYVGSADVMEENGGPNNPVLY